MPSLTMTQRPAIQGALLALLSASLFGISTPLIQYLGRAHSPWLIAALLYFGAALMGLATRAPRGQEAALGLAHLPRLLLMALFGAMLGPVLLAWGLQHTSAASASLMLTQEAVFTALLAILWYHEHLDRRIILAISLMTLGGLVLVFDQSQIGSVHVLGLLAVLGATLSWAIDNALSASLSHVDPSQVVIAKSTLGATCSLLITGLTGLHISSADSSTAIRLIGLILIGAIGYGFSIRLYLLAQRSFGAARTGSVFAAAPFLGAAAAFLMGEHHVSLWMLIAAGLMASGVILHLLERHDHEHHHPALEHEHAHSHDDGHHLHHHAPMPTGPHSHSHRHDAMTHHHPHVPDQHHQHSHDH